MIYTLPIHGEIGVDVTASSVMLQLANAKEYEGIDLDFDTIGGLVEEAKKIKSILVSSGKVRSSRNSGNVMSSGVELFMIAPIRTFDATKGGFLIHNPWNNTEGDAAQHEEVAKQLKKIEDDFAKEYSDKTGTDKETIKLLMAENRNLTAEEIQTYGFANIIERQQVQAKAIYKLKSNQMTELEIDNKLEGFGVKLLNTMKAMFKPKAMLLVDADGNELTLPDINDLVELTTGLTVTGVDDGSYTLVDGRVITVTGGVIAEIIEVENEMEALKKENETLKAQIEAKEKELEVVETEKVQAMAKFTELEKEFKSIRSSFKAKAETRTEEKNETKSFTYKKK